MLLATCLAVTGPTPAARSIGLDNAPRFPGGWQTPQIPLGDQSYLDPYATRIDSPALQDLLRQAARWWRATPDCGPATFWSAPGGFLVDHDALADDVRCRIILGRNRDPFVYPRRRAQACAIILHEYGHLLHWRHTGSGVMRPNPETPAPCYAYTPDGRSPATGPLWN